MGMMMMIMSSSLARRGELHPAEADAATRYTLALALPKFYKHSCVELGVTASTTLRTPWQATWTCSTT